MKIPEINGWEVTTNEKGIKMATLPRDTMEEILKYVEYADKQLRIHDVRYQLAISALEAIVDPIGYMRKQLKEDEKIDGMYATRIAERPEFYQDIVKKALEEIANCT